MNGVHSSWPLHTFPTLTQFTDKLSSSSIMSIAGTWLSGKEKLFFCSASSPPRQIFRSWIDAAWICLLSCRTRLEVRRWQTIRVEGSFACQTGRALSINLAQYFVPTISQPALVKSLRQRLSSSGFITRLVPWIVIPSIAVPLRFQLRCPVLPSFNICIPDFSLLALLCKMKLYLMIFLLNLSLQKINLEHDNKCRN